MDRLLRTLARIRRQGAPTGALSRLATGVSLAALLCTATACAGPEASARFAHTSESPEQLAAAVAGALKRKDVATLYSLALSEQEFRAHVWPRLPASRGDGHVPVGFVWSQLHQRSTARLAATIAEYAGRDLQVVGVRFLGETTDYEGFTVRRKAAVLVRGRDGAERAVRLFGSVVTAGGRHKVFSYVVD